MALAGYTGCEVGTKYPTDARELKKALDLRGLVVCNQWYSTEFITRPYADIEAEFRRKLEFLRIVGADVVGPSEQTRACQGNENIGVQEGKAVFDIDEWKRMIDGYNKLGLVAKEEGYKLCMHHHMGTGVQTPEEVERFLHDTNSDTVYLTYDSGHYSYNGSDPVVELKKVVSRVGHVHLKDLRPEIQAVGMREDWPFMKAVRQGVFTTPGDGGVDFPAIFKILDESGYEGWMVVEAEQDPAMANPFEYAKNAREYIGRHAGL